MDEQQRKALAKLSGRVTTVSEFLELTPAEEALIEVRLALRDDGSRSMQERRHDESGEDDSR